MPKLPQVETSENNISGILIYYCGNTWTDWTVFGIAAFRFQGHPFITSVPLWTRIL